MDMVIRSLATILLALTIPLASAQTLSLTIGNTVAAGGTPMVKTLQFCFSRPNGCAVADLSKAKVAATSAEGIVGNARRTVALDPRALCQRNPASTR